MIYVNIKKKVSRKLQTKANDCWEGASAGANSVASPSYLLSYFCMSSFTGERANEAKKQRVENLGSSCADVVDSPYNKNI